MRLDKWLWAARFYKTRSLAAASIANGRIDVDDVPAKASRELRIGNCVRVRHPGSPPRTIVVEGLSDMRGPASFAQTLYTETAQSIASREAAALARRLAPEPSLSIEQGRPTKRDRRQLVEWSRWSADAQRKPR